MPFAADPPPLPARAQALLDFWFGPPDHPERLHHKQIWFRSTAEFDAYFREDARSTVKLVRDAGIPQTE